MSSLFDRLEGAGNPVAPIRTHDIVEAVLDNIASLLNAREGCCQTRADYGMPDLNDVTRAAPEPAPVLAARVERLLRDFEPRLSEIAVVALDEQRPGEFAFSVQAVIADTAEEDILRFDTILTADRKPLVRRRV